MSGGHKKTHDEHLLSEDGCSNKKKNIKKQTLFHAVIYRIILVVFFCHHLWYGKRSVTFCSYALHVESGNMSITACWLANTIVKGPDPHHVTFVQRNIGQNILWLTARVQFAKVLFNLLPPHPTPRATFT